MGTQATSDSGFSLLELLLTLVIVGLIASLAGLGVSSGSRSYQVDAAAKHFADVAEYALDEAQMSGIDMGLFLEERGSGGDLRYSYQWLQRDIDGWSLAEFDEDAYGRKSLPPGMAVMLEVEQGNALVNERDAVDGEEQDQPQVVFYSSGETTPGIMTWVDDNSGDILWELEWDLLGRFSLRRRGEVDDESDYE